MQSYRKCRASKARKRDTANEYGDQDCSCEAKVAGHNLAGAARTYLHQYRVQ